MNALPPELTARLHAAGLDAGAVAALVRAALDEDLAGGVDVTSTAVVPEGHVSTADFVARAEGILAGLPVVAALLWLALGERANVRAQLADADRVAAGTVVLSVTGPTRELLMVERTALNLLGHLSGVATLTGRWVEAVAGTGARIRDTRKTTPGLRALEKYAVRCGGGRNHRMSLADAALIKDNHVLAAGGVAAAFAAVRRRFPEVPVEVECDTLEQVREAVAAGAGLVLLDNMPLLDIAEAVRIAASTPCRLEASGGLTLRNARAVAETGVHYLAVGALTHSAPVLDIGVDLRSPHVADR